MNTVGTAPVLLQSGTFYLYGLSSFSEVAPFGWTPLDFASAEEADWDAIGAPGNPDFSATGDPIQFGYATLNGGSATNDRLNAVGYVDNFEVEIVPSAPPVGTSVPSLGPLGTAALALSLGLAGLMRTAAKRRR